MKKLRKLSLIVLGACAVLSAGALCSCVTEIPPEPPPHSHVFGEWRTTEPPDCLNSGLRVRQCDCGERQSEILPALGHSLIHCDGQAPSCEEDGWKEYDECSRCDYTTYEVIAKTGHSYFESWTYDKTSHWHAASCGHNLKKDEGGHDFNAQNVCAECGFELGYSAGLTFILSENGAYYGVKQGTASGDIIIPEEYEGLPVTAIPENAFLNGSEVTSVTFGANISQIGASAFEGCSAIQKLVIPDTVKRIGRRAFYLCTSLKEISVPFTGESPQSDINAHFGWIFGAITASANGDVIPQSLENVTVRNVTKIAGNAFLNCSSIRSLDLNEEAAEIGGGAFTGTCFESAFVPSAVLEHLPKTNLKHLTVKCGSVGANAFKGITSLESVAFGKVGIIGYNAFQNCTSLESAVFSENVTEILDYAFRGCTALAAINIPDGVKSISNYSFADCTGVKSLTIGKDVTFIGTSAFMNCALIESAVIPQGITSLSSAFSGCIALKNVTLPKGLKRLSGTFSGCTSLEQITLPDGIESVDGFSGCSSLKSIIVPDCAKDISRGAFAGCSKLEEITLPFVGRSVKKSTDYSQYPFGWIFGTRSYEGGVATEQTYYNFNFDAPDGKTTYYIPSSLKRVTVTGGEILLGAFSNCVNLTSVTLGSGVSGIQREAFTGCSNLSSVTFKNVTGWTVSAAADGEGSAVNVSLPSNNAKYLTDTYLKYFWKRKI